MAKSFSHQPLHLSRRCIRLLHLLKPTPKFPVRCRLDEHVFSPGADIVEYNAVSYEWGDQKKPKVQIEVNGSPFEVGQNLHDFLSNLVRHHPTEAAYNLWIDAICINQTDTAEKNHQVRQMANIYRNAAGVLIWLGPAADNSDWLIGFLNDVDGERYSEMSRVAVVAEKLKERALFVTAMPSLCRRSYWQRIWIIQEITLAKRRTIFCGSKCLAWEKWSAFSSLSAEVRDWHLRGLDLGEIPSITAWLSEKEGSQVALSDSLGQGASRGLLDLVFLFGRGQCTIRQDKIYALLGICHGQGSHDVSVDYDIPLATIMVQLCRTSPIGEQSSRAFQDLKNLLHPSDFELLIAFQPRHLQYSLQQLHSSNPELSPEFAIDVDYDRYESTRPLTWDGFRAAMIVANFKSNTNNQSTFRDVPDEDEHSVQAKLVSRRYYSESNVRCEAWPVCADPELFLQFPAYMTLKREPPYKLFICRCDVCEFHRAKLRHTLDISGIDTLPMERIRAYSCEGQASDYSFTCHQRCAYIIYYRTDSGDEIYWTSSVVKAWHGRLAIMLFFDPTFARRGAPAPSFEFFLDEYLNEAVHIDQIDRAVARTTLYPRPRQWTST